VNATRLAVAILIIACLSSLCIAQATYTFTDLGAIQSNGFSVAKGVNATAQVTGSTGPNDGSTSEVFSYSDNAMTGLGTLGGDSGIGNAINASGEIAGYSTNAYGTYRAFLAINGTLTDIGDLGGGSAVAYGINDLGQVVGSAVTSDGSNHPFLYSNGKMIDLGTLGSPEGSSWWNSAQGVNNSGEVTGTSYTAKSGFFAFLWSKGKMTKMGTLGGPYSQGYAINNQGQVTGIAYLKNGEAHAFIANCATCKLKDLGAFGSTGTTWGFGINDSGVVVGQGSCGCEAGYVAFVYSNGKLQDLNKLIPAGTGWTLIEAAAINDAGQIVGTAIRGQEEHGYLLTPQ
jgi:probable HAF family extracellular repeat protein